MNGPTLAKAIPNCIGRLYECAAHGIQLCGAAVSRRSWQRL